MKITTAVALGTLFHSLAQAETKLECFESVVPHRKLFTITGLANTDSIQRVQVQFRDGPVGTFAAVTLDTKKEMDWGGAVIMYRREIENRNIGPGYFLISLTQKFGHSHSFQEDAVGTYTTLWNYGEVRCNDANETKPRGHL